MFKCLCWLAGTLKALSLMHHMPLSSCNTFGQLFFNKSGGEARKCFEKTLFYSLDKSTGGGTEKRGMEVLRQIHMGLFAPDDDV